MKNGIINCVLIHDQMVELKNKAFLGMQGIQQTMKAVERFNFFAVGSLVDDINWGKRSFDDSIQKSLFEKIKEEVSVERLEEIASYNTSKLAKYERVLVRELMQEICDEICEMITDYIDNHVSCDYLTSILNESGFEEEAFDYAEKLVNNEVESLAVTQEYIDMQNNDVS